MGTGPLGGDRPLGHPASHVRADAAPTSQVRALPASQGPLVVVHLCVKYNLWVVASLLGMCLNDRTRWPWMGNHKIASRRGPT